MSRFSRRACAFGGGRRGLRRQGGQGTAAAAYDFGQYTTPYLHIADDAADITETGLGVSGWTDKAGNNTIGQATDADRPEFLGEGNGVRFAVSNTESLDITSAGAFSANYVYLFADLNIHSQATVRYLLDMNGTNRLIFYLDSTATTQVGVFDGSNFRNCGALSTGRQTLVWECDFVGNAVSVWSDATLVGTNPALGGGGNLGGATGAISQAATSASGFTDTTVYRMVMYGRSSKFSDAQRQEIEANL